MSNQPKWKFLANLGDANPIEHGGLFVFVDETGVYPPEMERLEMDDDNEDDEARQRFTIHRVCLDQCTFVNGVLSDNKFHPDFPAWWAGTEAEKRERPQDSTYLSNVADFCGIPEEELIGAFCDDNPLPRAEAYRCVLDYHGWDNGDSDPLRNMTRTEVESRYEGIKPGSGRWPHINESEVSNANSSN